MRAFLVAALLLASAVPAIAGKPGPGGGSPPPNTEVGYRVLSGKSVKLMVANADATNAVSLYTSPTSFSFDLGPRSTNAIAIVNGSSNTDSKLYLLTYATSGSGVIQTQSITPLTSARRGSHADFSPDGTKIAFACCSDGTSETLAVYDLQTGTVTPWATAPFFWDFAFFRNGASIAYSVYGPTALWEVAGPGATPQELFSPNAMGEIDVDASRTDPNLLVVSFNDASGDARIGFFDASTGQLTDGDIARSTKSWQGHLDCSDRRLAYMGVQNTSGSQAFYIRDLQTGLTSLFSKSSNILLQFFPTCQ